MILTLQLVFAVIALACATPAKRASLTPLDPYNTEELDDLVRRKLVFLIVSRINDTMRREETMQNSCERQINSTADSCKTCAASHGSPSPTNPLDAVLPVLLNSALQSGSLVEFVASTLTNPAVIKLLGKETIQLAKNLEGVAQTAGGFLLGGAKDILDGAVGELKGLGDKLTHLTSDIGHSLETAVTHLTSGTLHLGTDIGHELEHIGSGLISGAEHTANQIAHGATDAVNSLAHGAEQVGHAISSGVSSIGHALGSIFGKRSQCPACDKISSKDGTVIVTAVCGSTFMNQLQKTESQITHMKTLYSSAVNNTLIEKVEYDPASIDTTDGVQFKVVHVTYAVNGQQARYSSSSSLQMFNLPAMADGLASEIYSRFVQ